MAGVLFASVSLAGGFNIAGGVTSYFDHVQENRSQIAAGNVATGVAGTDVSVGTGAGTAQINPDTGGPANSKVQTEENQQLVQNHVINENTIQNTEMISVRTGLENFTDNYGHYLAFIWIGVGIALIIRMMISFIKLRASLRFACKLPEEENVYESAGIKSSFVLGIVKPKIYVPEGVGKAELDMILRHEKAHIEAKDNITIILAYIIMAVFWFNPVFWLYYGTVRRDIELYCDERSTDDMDRARKAEYSRVLLAYAVNPDKAAVAGFSSGESQVKERVENVLSENTKSKRVRRIIAATAIVICVLLVIAGIGVASWYKGDGYNVNKKALITTSEVVRILENNGITLEKDNSIDPKEYTVTDIDASGNEYQLTPKAYVGKAVGDISQWAKEREPAEHDVRVLIYEMQHYEGGKNCEYPRMSDAFPNYVTRDYDFYTNTSVLDGKNIRMVFMKTTEQPPTDYETDEEIEEYNRAVLTDYEGAVAMAQLKKDIYEVLFEKAFNGKTEIYTGESENWKVMMPIKQFNEKLDIDMVSYSTSGNAEGYMLFQRKDGETASSKVYSLSFYAGGSSSVSNSMGESLVESEEYPGWYKFRNLENGSFYDNFVAGKSRYSVSITDGSGVPEFIVLVPEGTEYDWEKGKKELEVYKETALYKAAEPAITEYIKSRLTDYIDIKEVEIFDWRVKDGGKAAEFSCNVVYNYYNTDVEKVDYIQFVKEHAKGDYSNLYETYEEYYLSSKLEELNLKVYVKNPTEIGADETVIPSALESGVLSLYNNPLGADESIYNLTIDSFLNPYGSLKIVYEPGSKHVLHRSEVSARLNENNELEIYG